MLTPVSHSFTYGAKRYNNFQPYNSFKSNDHLDNLNVPADIHPRADAKELTDNKTGNQSNVNNNNIHVSLPNQRLPLKQQSSDSYTDESPFNTFDKSDEEFEFSDSAAFNAFKSGNNKGNIYQNSDAHGIVTWQTDTSPSDNLETDDVGYDVGYGTIARDRTPSPDFAFADQSSGSSRNPTENNLSGSENLSPNGNSTRPAQRGSNILQLMSNLHRTQPNDGRTSLASPDG